MNLKHLVLLFCLVTTAAKSQKVTCQSNKKNTSTSSLYYSSPNLRSDTFDILNYTINLDVTDFTNQTIKGSTIVKFVPKLNPQNFIHLDLLQLTIDSIKQSNDILNYTYNDTLLKINFPTALTTNDTSFVEVFYHGHPQVDPTGWGGFSFEGNYAYNLGVGFGANPHTYGRSWFPCFDNFTEKSTYEFNITTSTTRTSFCNGQLMSDVVNGATRTRKWILNKEIPTYLASVSVSDYTQVNWNTTSLNGNLPINLVARASDTTGLKSGFIHLPNAIHAFENYYGPYAWNRVGYCLTPNGAMEHPTNISYPVDFTAISNESSLMAHELSHHWWGDLMTCETQEDMWLNEGMASYSERLFLEYTYNYGKYLTEVKTIHDDILKYVHLREKGFRAISGIPFEYTYGDHVYKKGADVAHTLRTYMGDADFFNGLKYVMQQKSFKNMNSLEFRDLLETSSGKNLHSFFDNWVLNGGWPHFSIDSVNTISATAPFTSIVYVKQKLFGAPSLYSNVPLELTVMNNVWNKEVTPIVMSGAANSFTIQTNTKPNFVGMNVESKISDAISSEYKIIKTTGNITYSLGRALLMVANKGIDSSLIRIEHNIVAPDAIKNNTNNYVLNTQHYWKLDGLMSNGFIGKIRLNYDGNKNPSGNSYLDTCLTAINGDSIILLYRKNAADDWHELPSYAKFKIGTRSGFFTTDSFRLGEYVFANGLSHLATLIDETQSAELKMEVYPNPIKDEVTVNLVNYELTKNSVITICDMHGKKIKTIAVTNDETKINLKELHLSANIYIINLMEKNKNVMSQKIILE